MNRLASTQTWQTRDAGPDARLQQAQRQLAREKQARLEAEKLAERGLRDLSTSRSRIELLNKIAILANEVEEPQEVMRRAIRDICTSLGYAFGNVLVPDATNPIFGTPPPAPLPKTLSKRRKKSGLRPPILASSQGPLASRALTMCRFGHPGLTAFAALHALF
jgi:hypothetical protein